MQSPWVDTSYPCFYVEVLKVAQAFDGLALGSAFVRAGFSRLKYCIFAALFVMVTPCGIAIGIGVSQSYAPGSKAALGTEAAFNSVSAGELSVCHTTCHS